MTTTDPTKAIVKAQPADNLAEYFHRPDIISKFHAVLGNEANAYVQSVLIACTANADLMRCDPQSILRSSLRAASLELSCDPALKQAYLVPIQGKAEFWPHYRGLYTLMVRTGKYYAINVTPVREGQRVMQHSTTGIHYLMLENGLLVENDKLSKLFSQGYQDVTDGAGDKKIIGYLGYFETNKGFKKTVYMSMSDINEHAEMYSPGFHNPKSPWNNPKMRPSMDLKTVFRELIKWGDMSGKDAASAALRSAIQDDDSEREWANDEEITDAVAHDAPPEEEQPEKRTEEQNLSDLGYEPLKEAAKILAPEPKNSLNIDRPLSPVTLRSMLAAKAAKKSGDANTNQLGLMDGMMNEAFAPDPDADKIRHSCLRFLWGVDSSKKMTGPQVKATLDWLKPVKDAGGAYSIDPMASQELHGVWTAANVEAGQGKLI
jgi:recombination protein RecT